MNRRVLHILNTSTYSGAENIAMLIIKSLGEGYQCAYASLDGPIRHMLEGNQIQFTPLRKVSVPEVRRACSEFKPDIIHAHDFTASIVCAFSGIRVPIISHLHNNPPWLQTLHLYSFIYLLSSRRYRRILAVSKSVVQEYVFGQLIKKKSMVIPNTINASAIREKSLVASEDVADRYDIVFIGRLAPQKDVFRFIRVIKILTEDIPTVKAVVIGDGDLKEKCNEYINLLGLNENIKLTGFLYNPYPLMKNSKLLCITSLWEGFGLVAAEALALNKPVVGTPVGGLPGIIDETCGKLCNSDDEFACEIKKLLLDDEYWRKKSWGAMQRAKELTDIENYMDKVKEVYSELAK